MSVTIHGASVKRIEDPRLIRGEGTYLANRTVDGQLWMLPIRSDVPHATVTSVDTEAVLNDTATAEIYTHADFADHLMPIDAPKQPESTRRPLITDRARFVGDIVAVVVAESPEQARDAADVVWPEYDLLDAVVDVDTAFEETSGLKEVFLEPAVPEPSHAAGQAPVDPQEEEGVVVFRAGMTMEDLEKEAIRVVLEEVGGNRRKAAEYLGIGERTLYRKIKEYGL